MTRHQPLYIRLYFEAHLLELVRLIAYRALPVAEAKEQLTPLVQRYGKEKINAAIKELLEVDRTCDPPLARLNRTAREAAWQLLGPPSSGTEA
jgi:hypothetical protein